MPFNVLPTKIHKVEGVWGEPPPEQLSRAARFDSKIISAAARASSLSDARAATCRGLLNGSQETYNLNVQQLRGDMADTNEQSKP